jgi:hypothetical protein
VIQWILVALGVVLIVVAATEAVAIRHPGLFDPGDQNLDWDSR